MRSILATRGEQLVDSREWTHVTVDHRLYIWRFESPLHSAMSRRHDKRCGDNKNKQQILLSEVETKQIQNYQIITTSGRLPES